MNLCAINSQCFDVDATDEEIEDAMDDAFMADLDDAESVRKILLNRGFECGPLKPYRWKD